MLLPLKPALLAASLVLIADGVPRFDVELFCRRIAAMAVALEEMEICLRKEREARDQLLQQWTQFPAADRSYCQQLTTTGLDPTYTELITCLELQRDARSLREKDAETAGTSAKPTSKPARR